MSEEKEKGPQSKIIFQLGTNNWQWLDEPAPGSGILHEAHHNAYNSLENVMSYSIYPSVAHTTADVQNNENDLIRIYKLDKNIPICESAAPNSKRRWHGMSQDEVDDYRSKLEDMVYKYLNDIEARHGKGCVYFCVAHHTFMNCVILSNVMKKREEKKLSVPTCVVYVHGTGLKMYQNELKKLDEYPAKFYRMMKDLNVFDTSKDSNSYIRYALANSNRIVDQFVALFPKFEAEKCMVNYPGFNQNVFKMFADSKLNDVLKELQLKALEIAEEKKDNDAVVVAKDEAIGAAQKYDHLVAFIGKLADWKRMDYLMAASEIYDAHFKKANKNVLTLVIGGGPDDAKVVWLKQIAALASSDNVCYVGPKMQPILTKLLNVAEVGVYPSKNEPFGLVFIETMACGTPVIGAKSGGPMDFITEDVGVLIEENEKEVMVKDIAKCIIEFIDEDVKTAKQKACLECAAKFTVIEQQRKLLNALDPLLK
eukprot:209229_1